MNILFLSRWLPLPATNGSKLRISNLLKGIAAQHAVTLMTFYEDGEDPQQSSQLHEICERVVAFKWKPFDPNSTQQQRAWLNRKPRSVVQNFSAEFADCIKVAISNYNIDLVIASEFATATYAPYFAGTPAIFEDVELSVLKDQYESASSLSKRARRGLMWRKHSAYLKQLAKHYQFITTPSIEEQNNLAEILGSNSKIRVVPNCLDLKRYPTHRTVEQTKLKQKKTLLFTGAFTYHVNYNGMRWFLNDVYSHIQLQHPDVRLRITGQHNDLPLPPATNVTLTGFVDDIYAEISQANVAIVPLLLGGGTRLKILEAMILGTPVVSTSKGAEGLDCEDGTHLLIADTPAQFAAAVNRLLSDSQLRQQLVANAYQLVIEKYDWDAVLPHFLQLMNTAAHKPKLPTHSDAVATALAASSTNISNA